MWFPSIAEFVRRPKAFVAIVALAAAVCLPAGAQDQPQGRETAPAEAVEATEPQADQGPAAYVVSFRFIKVSVAEGLDPREFADIPSGSFSFAPDDGDGFYDRVALAEAYGPKIRPGLVATVGPVYSMCMKPNSDPKAVSGWTGDGEYEWSASAWVEPLTPDGKKLCLHSGWDLSHVFGFGDGGMGTSEHWLNVPLQLHSGDGAGTGTGDDGFGPGTRFTGGWTVLVLIEPAVP